MATKGNPLFVEQMVALVKESGTGDVHVPPTISALLTARLEQLGDEERSVLERFARSVLIDGPSGRERALSG